MYILPGIHDSWYHFSVSVCSHTLYTVYPVTLPNDKSFDWSRLKAFADDKINLAEKLTPSLGRVENTRKREKCWLPEFSPFPVMFSKPSLPGSLKVGIVWKS